MTDYEATVFKLHQFKLQNLDIPCLTRTAADFDVVRSIYAHPEIIPLAILCPATIQEVQTVVAFLSSNRFEFTIRSGGHDMHGRSMKQDTIVVDMRQVNYVRIHTPSEPNTAQGVATAIVGGGVLIGDLISHLQTQGYATPVGSVPSVGYVGWAMYGGYGAYSAQFGLGVDQIIGAKVVNARGDLIEADESLLTGIRGAGGAFGVIVEMTVKIYKMNKILAGMIMYRSEDLQTVIPEYNEAYRALASKEGLPPALSVHQGVLNAPTPTFTVLFVWSCPNLTEGYRWLEKIKSLGPCVASTVQETTPHGCLEEADRHFAKSTQGRMWTISMRQITDEVARVIAEYTSNMPYDPHILFDMHELRECSPSARLNEDSVFSAREPHFVIEINTIVSDQNKIDAALAWGREFRDALRNTSAGNIMPAQYLSFMAEEEVDQLVVFGESLSFLKHLKSKHDPGDVFNAAISYLGS
ncbi:hypothetical protein BJX64DRAFT_275521 [Aspergillus heterothallicus]